MLVITIRLTFTGRQRQQPSPLDRSATNGFRNWLLKSTHRWVTLTSSFACWTCTQTSKLPAARSAAAVAKPRIGRCYHETHKHVRQSPTTMHSYDVRSDHTDATRSAANAAKFSSRTRVCSSELAFPTSPEHCGRTPDEGDPCEQHTRVRTFHND